MMEVLITKCEEKFTNAALEENIRLYGRKLNEARKLKLHFGSSWRSFLVSLGQKRVMANVSCDIQQPKLSRLNEGLSNMNVELNLLAAAHFEVGRQSEVGVALTRQLERCFKDSRCLDMEFLCIVVDKKVWNIRIDMNVINHDGNLVDCSRIVSLSVLSHLHRSDITSIRDGVIIHSFAEDLLPLKLFHQPVGVSFYMFENGKTVMDPI
ncbi:GSCOCG00011354001-RA-CDS [Cotesia congregata]|uniref:Similar to EXOSC9: Exosome complex component RRP45 (Bos taurus) n=1 Tax=Cotesia congregata TaxID=51543 RepID=A0A8J2E4R5_COTCN|nr:GSCOCG00011354001-RA-CDS [Cotesia congregata]CAG5073395.1 Similar to EXOSC9: Exosome complex component RRP45 (Bos taurus) [Cotesia congregata]